MEEHPWKKDREQVFRVYHLARRIWDKRYELTPTKGVTWADWFKAHAGMTLDAFAEWAKKHRLREAWNQSVKKSGYGKKKQGK
tara:strand:- start:1162 stop:1410 length:249 start_codon:yes stop_codon:yes gene_type:complete